jgi:REP element-mobilizing transposase RayT
MSTDQSFGIDGPLAFLLTWTAYGTWLPGDERGWHRKGVADSQAGNPLFVEMAASKLREPPFTLGESHRRLVDATIRRHCEVRGWVLHAVNARSNHVHVVVTAPGYPPERVAEQFKAWCTRRLKEHEPGRQRYWTEGGSCRWIHRQVDLEAAVVYVTEAQVRKGVEEAER